MDFPFTPPVKRALNIAIVFALLILLHSLAEQLLSATIVEHILSYIDSAWYNDIIFLGCIIVCMLFLVIKFRKFAPSIFFLSLIAGFAVFYTYYRFAGHPWKFTGFYFLPVLKYGDLLIVATVVYGLLYVVYTKPGLKANNAQSFFDDTPLGENQLDNLGYTHYAKNLAEKIQHSYFPKSFAIGINGKWGTGKTSFIDLLKRALKEEDMITVEFNPWNSHTPTAIIKDFFDTVQEAIQPFDKGLASQFVKYANKLVELNDNTVTKSVQAFASLIAGGDSLNTLFKSINASLENISKKMVIYIDDLDRLDKDEIVEVIRLIRNTANFYNTFFIVAYSKNYIAEALKTHNPFNHDQFLEKIFQFELTLPHFNKLILREKLVEKLLIAFPEEYHTPIQELIHGSSIVAPINLSDWIDTLRDVTRLSNSITLNMKNLMGEVDISDFIRVDILRLKLPSVHELLYHKKHLFFKPQSDHNIIEPKLHLVRAKDSLQSFDRKDENEYYLKLYLNDNADHLGVKKNETETIVDYIKSLFADSNSYNYHLNKNLLSVAYSSKFDRYFAYAISEADLSEIEFNEARKLNQVGFNKQITKWVENGLAVDVQRRLMHIKSFENRPDFEKVITAIFHLAGHPANGQASGLVIGYDGKDLYEKISDYDAKLSGKLYPDAGGKEGLKIFIQSILERAVNPFYFESQFVQFAADRLYQGNSFPLQKEELKQLSLQYLSAFCDQTEKLDHVAFMLLANTRQTDYVDAGDGSYNGTKYIPQKAKEILKSYVLKDFDEYLLWIIRVEPFNGKAYSVEQSVPELFNGWDNFKLFLEKQDEEKWKSIPEFKRFYEKASANNFSHFVPFAFEVIPIERRTQ